MRRCENCQAVYPADHWASGRERCPACGGAFAPSAGPIDGPPPLHCDSAAELHFELDDLLRPEQRVEMGWFLLAGLVLFVAAALARLGYVWWTGQGFVPLWLDGLVIAMLSVAMVLVIHASRRLWRHRRALGRR